MAKKKMGRPRKEISKESFEQLCKLQCTEKEICGFFGVCEDTLNSWCKRTYKLTFSETYKVYSVDGKISLRRYQMKLAERSAVMAIFLGKNMLGQSDDPQPLADNAVAQANDQIASLADLINNPVKGRSFEELEEESAAENGAEKS